MPTILATWVHKAEAEGSQASSHFEQHSKTWSKKKLGRLGHGSSSRVPQSRPQYHQKKAFFFS
jgi:hypothetical protein